MKTLLGQKTKQEMLFANAVLVSSCVEWDTGQPLRGVRHWSARAWSGTLVSPCVERDTGQPVRGVGHWSALAWSGTLVSPCVEWDTDSDIET